MNQFRKILPKGDVGTSTSNVSTNLRANIHFPAPIVVRPIIFPSISPQIINPVLMTANVTAEKKTQSQVLPVLEVFDLKKSDEKSENSASSLPRAKKTCRSSPTACRSGVADSKKNDVEKEKENTKENSASYVVEVHIFEKGMSCEGFNFGTKNKQRTR